MNIALSMHSSARLALESFEPMKNPDLFPIAPKNQPLPTQSPTHMNDIAIISEARESTIQTLSSPAYNEGRAYADVGSIWQENIQTHLDNIVNSATSLPGIFDRLNQHTFYDINFGPKNLTEASIKWRLKHYSSHSRDSKNSPLFSESSLIDSERCISIDGHRFSSDLVWRLSIAKRLAKVIPFPSEPFNILEIGGGYGALARTLKKLYPHCKYIIVDLPHSLFFQYCFLKHAFPDAQHKYISNDAPQDLSSADFIYLPHKWLHLLKGKSSFLAVNTNSFGEMPLEESQRYITFMQDSMKVEYLFSLNRFLNRIDNQLLPRRSACAGNAFQYDPLWQVLDWEVDPDYERCPFLSTLLTRNLHLIMKRQAISPPDHSGDILCPSLDEIALEDWNTRPFWANYHLQLDGELGKHYPPIMSRADQDLTPNLTINGTLFNLWENHRLSPHKEPVIRLLIRYLSNLGGVETPFEDLFYLLKRVSKSK